LSRAAIVDAAVGVVERGGPEALTMRNVAAAVGAKPMSLYNHVGGRDDLLDAMFDLVLAEVTFPALDRGRWQDQLRSGWSDFRRALLVRPALIPLVFARGGTGPAYFRAIEHSLAIFRGAGFDAEHALHATRLVVGVTFGALMNELGAITNGPVAVIPDGYPMLAASAPYLGAPDFEAAWAFAMDTVIAGLEDHLARL